jgi:hypothetical protein
MMYTTTLGAFMLLHYLITFLLCIATLIQCSPIIIHDKSIDAPNAHFVPLPTNSSITPPHMTYIPQQLIVVRDHAKQLPVTAYPLCKRACYIKCALQEADENIEFFIRKETIDHRAKEQLSEQNFNRKKNRTIRFYRKINLTNKWQPIISMPEHILFSPHTRIIIQPDGTLQIRPHF